MIVVRRRRTIRELEEAVFLLRDQLAEANPDAIRTSAAYGCCGCGAWMANVVTPRVEGAPYGESYCWRCVRRRRITGYVELARS